MNCNASADLYFFVIREIAQHAGPYVDIIVGGHSHTLLFNGEPPEGSTFTPRGPYPVVVELETRSVSSFRVLILLPLLYLLSILNTHTNCQQIYEECHNFMNRHK